MIFKKLFIIEGHLWNMYLGQRRYESFLEYIYIYIFETLKRKCY